MTEKSKVDFDAPDWREQLEAAEATGYLADLLQRQVDSLERQRRSALNDGIWTLPRDPFEADDYSDAEGLRRVAYPIEERRERDTRWLYASQLSPVEVWLQRGLLLGALALAVRLLVWAI